MLFSHLEYKKNAHLLVGTQKGMSAIARVWVRTTGKEKWLVG
jgi:hypothetical protein